MIESRDFNQLIDIVELVMGIVVSSEERDDYIGKILDLDQRT